jgi:hypothetical protein
MMYEDIYAMLQEIPILGDNNWIHFNRRARQWLDFSGYDDLLISANTNLREGNAIQHDCDLQKKSWTRRNEIACRELGTRIVGTAFRLVKDQDNLGDMMGMLEADCRKNAQQVGVLTKLTQRFRSLRLENYKRVLDYAEMFLDINERLAFASKQMEISDGQLALQFMLGLSSSYNPLVVNWQRNRLFVEDERRPDEKVITFDEMVREAINEEMRQSNYADLRKREKDRSRIAQATTKPKIEAASPTGRNVRCSHCSVRGHELSSCYYEHPELAPASWKPKKRLMKRKENDQGNESSTNEAPAAKKRKLGDDSDHEEKPMFFMTGLAIASTTPPPPDERTLIKTELSLGGRSLTELRASHRERALETSYLSMDGRTLTRLMVSPQESALNSGIPPNIKENSEWLRDMGYQGGLHEFMIVNGFCLRDEVEVARRLVKQFRDEQQEEWEALRRNKASLSMPQKTSSSMVKDKEVLQRVVLWHNRMGHLKYSAVLKLPAVSRGIEDFGDVDIRDLPVCEYCDPY